MKMARKIIEARMKVFQEACARMGIKNTHQRTEIFRTVIATDEHPDAVSVYRQVKRRIPAISLDTVYRNLKMLAENDLIAIVGMSHESLRFDGNRDHHHHFTCMKCGLIRDFTSESANAWDIPGEARRFGNPLSFHVEVKGICETCQNFQRKK